MCTFLLLQQIICSASAERILGKTSIFRHWSTKQKNYKHQKSRLLYKVVFMKAFENGDAI